MCPVPIRQAPTAMTASVPMVGIASMAGGEVVSQGSY